VIPTIEHVLQHPLAGDMIVQSYGFNG